MTTSLPVSRPSSLGAAAAAAPRAAALSPSRIRQIYDAAQARPDALRLEVGEPDFATPPWIIEAANRAAAAGQTHYTSNIGIPVLREALAAKLAARNGYVAHPDQIVVSAGGVQALHLVLAAMLDPGDEVLLPDPCWPNFRMIAHLIGASAVGYVLRPERAFQPDPAELEALITPRTRVLVVNLPSNPVGVCGSRDDLAALVDIAARHGLWLLSDECYDEITFDGPILSAGAVADYERTVSVYSFSKTYAMTGWRVGYAVAPLATVEVLARMQEPLVSCVNTPAQFAALAALEGPQGVVADMRDAYRRRRDLALDVLTAGGVEAFRPDGAFYLWADIGRRGLPSMEFALSLLAEEGVAVAPGSAFGASGDDRVRISLATGEDDLLEGCRRLVRFLTA